MALAAALCASFQAASAADTNTATTEMLGNPMIARGTGLAITRGDLDDAMAPVRNAYQKQGQAMSATQAINIEKQVLNNLIDTKLLLAKATDADKAAGKNAADLQVTAAIENAGSADAFNQRLKANGMTEADVRAKVAEQATAQSVLQREMKITVTDDEIKAFYDGHTADYEQPEMAHISHIVVFTVDPMTGVPLPPDQLNARRKMADNLVKAARAGDDFEKLAQQYSEDPGTKSTGGELPPFPRGQMLHEIEDAAFSMTNSQVSDVIGTSSGYQIIKLIEKTPARKMGYLAAAARVKDELLRLKTAQKEPIYLSGLQKDAGVEILDPNLKTAPATGAATP